MLKVTGEEEKILSGLLTKLLNKLVSMLTETERQEREALGLFGFKELMRLQDLTALHMDNSLTGYQKQVLKLIEKF